MSRYFFKSILYSASPCSMQELELSFESCLTPLDKTYPVLLQLWSNSTNSIM